MNIVRHMELTVMQDDKEEQDQQVTEDYRKIEQYSKEYCESHEQLGMNGYSVSARNYLQGYSGGLKLQGSRHKVFSKQQREFRGIL